MNAKSITQGQKNILVWAVDPTQKPGEAKNIIHELKIWAKHLNCEVQPVSIFSSASLNFPFKLAFPWKERFEELSEKTLGDYLRKAGARSFLPARVLYTTSISNRKMAGEIAKYAEHEGSPLIFAHTRAQKTWNPFRLGGFAETLVNTSRVPVLLLNPAARPSAKIPKILFPTDFSRDSSNALHRLLPWAKAFDSELIIYNQLETLNIPASEANGLWPAHEMDFQKMMKDIETTRRKKAEKFTKILQDERVETSILIKRQKKYISADIVDAANANKVSLIAIASRSGPVDQIILGGVAQDVLLHAKCPVLVFFRPKAVRRRKQKVEYRERVQLPQDNAPQTAFHQG